MVEEYTRLSISVPSDRLPALSGLAQQWHLRKNCDYIAGLWKDSLIKDLQWGVGLENAAPKPKEWRAPSWSWASVNGPVHYYTPSLYHYDDCSTVIDVKRALKGSDTFGEVEAGHVLISGELVQAELIAGKYKDIRGFKQHVRPLASANKEAQLAGQEACKELDKWIQNGKLGDTLGYFPVFPDYELPASFRGTENIASIQKVYCLKLSQRIDDIPLEVAPSLRKSVTIFAIVLRCLDSSTQLYERIGYVRPVRLDSDIKNCLFFGHEPTSITII